MTTFKYNNGNCVAREITTGKPYLNVWNDLHYLMEGGSDVSKAKQDFSHQKRSSYK